MISAGVRFGQIYVITLCIRRDRHEKNSVEPDQTPQNEVTDHTLFATHLAGILHADRGSKMDLLKRIQW